MSKLLLVEGELINLAAVERIWRDGSVNPSQLVVQFTSGAEARYSLDGLAARKLLLWMRASNPCIEELTEGRDG